jgi:hypothetical protein
MMACSAAERGEGFLGAMALLCRQMSYLTRLKYDICRQRGKKEGRPVGSPLRGNGGRSLVGEDFAVFEEALEFDGGGFG